MTPIRVLIVDDAPLARRLISRAFARHSEIEIAGTAETGEEALSQLAHIRPDVVILDIEMPGIGGLEALVRLRQTHPRLPVIMFSSLTEDGARATIDALTRGANECVLKPRAGSGPGIDAIVSDTLVPLALALTGRGAAPPLSAPKPPAPAVRRLPPPPPQIVTVAASTGGPVALDVLLDGLRATLRVPMLVVQHMPPLFTRHLAERLARACGLSVTEASDGERVTRGKVLMAPGGKHLGLVRDGASVLVRLTQDPPENACRPAADYMFRAAASAYGASVLGVVLTGMGHDGTLGAEAIVKAGGRVIIQNEATSAIWGMPGAVQRAGFADGAFPLDRLSKEIDRRTGGGQTSPARPPNVPPSR